MEKGNLLFRNSRSANRLFAFFILAILFSGCAYHTVEVDICGNLNSTYAQSIAPLIQTTCAKSGCHNGDSTSVGNFTNYAELKMRVDSGQFKLKVIDSKLMPPASQPALSSEDFNKLKCWFEAGALNN